MNDAGGGRQAAQNYEWWAQLLLDEFLPELGPDEVATLSVDRDSLAEASGVSEAAAELGRAVRSRLGPGCSLQPILRACRIWERSKLSGAHPALPVLALTVIAAADMGESPDFHGNDFYRPLRLLIDPSDHGRGPFGDFQDVIDELWASLDRWLEEGIQGERGVSSFKPPPHPRHIGYSLSQAAVRGPDRRLLRRFLAMALDDEQLTVEELRAPLAEWARRRGMPGRRLVRLAQSPRLAGICAVILRQELDQLLDRRTAGRRGQVHVLVELRPLRVQLVPSRPTGFPAQSLWHDALGGHHEISSLTGDWYEPLPLNHAEVVEAFRSGLRLGEPPHVIELEQASVLALAYDQTLGAWRSVNRLGYGETHLLLVAAEQIDAVERFLAIEGTGARVRSDLASALPGWSLVQDVRLERRPLSEAPPDLARLLGAGGGPTARLVGGLRVPPLRHRYLTGGEPLVRLPWSATTDQRVELVHNGDVIRLRPTAQGDSQAELPLSGLSLEAGHYTIRVGARAMAFELVDWLVEALPRRVCDVTSWAGREEICGYLPTQGRWERRPPLTWPAKPFDEVMALGARDDEFVLARDPAWLDELAGGLAWDLREIDAPFPVAWIVVRRRCGTPIAWPRCTLEPLASGNAVARWRTTIDQATPSDACTASHRRRLARYQAVARRAR